MHIQENSFSTYEMTYLFIESIQLVAFAIFNINDGEPTRLSETTGDIFTSHLDRMHS